MKETKEYCDRCGKEDRTSQIMSYNYVYPWLDEGYKFRFDLCKDCMKEFKFCIKNFMLNKSNRRLNK